MENIFFCQNPFQAIIRLKKKWCNLPALSCSCDNKNTRPNTTIVGIKSLQICFQGGYMISDNLTWIFSQRSCVLFDFPYTYIYQHVFLKRAYVFWIFLIYFAILKLKRKLPLTIRYNRKVAKRGLHILIFFFFFLEKRLCPVSTLLSIDSTVYALNPCLKVSSSAKTFLYRRSG